MKVFVGLSGGVDSAVSAALLKEQGHDVTGVFIRIYRPEFIECTWKEDRLDAMRVCAALNIPFREIDLSDEYKRGVVDKMLGDYAAGITPNPDVLCNREIKFGAFLTWARESGADKIATGHYARTDANSGPYRLLRGRDQSKDQSYFLFRLQEADLKHALFPVGGLLKSEVRLLAKKLDLPVAKKHDSQGLCFIGDVTMADFLKQYLDITAGPVVDVKGRRIGEHHGVALVTIGQRHGFSLAGNEVQDAQPAGMQAHYVVAIDIEKNEIVVSPNRDDAKIREVTLRDTSFVGDTPKDGDCVEVQARYREPAVAATVRRGQGTSIRIHFDEPHIAPPGQSLVMYKGSVCIGGGVIEKSVRMH